MRYGLNLITFLFIFLLTFVLTSSKSLKTKEKIIYITKPIFIEKEIIKEISLYADTIIKPQGLPVLSDVLNKSINKMSGFGYRFHPIHKKMRMHTGIDIGCRADSEVLSTANGKVVRVQYTKYGYGNNIIIEHSNKYKTLYAHLKNISVKVNQNIKRGQVIGYSGNTGTSTSPHLHYEVIVNNKKVDPILYL